MHDLVIEPFAGSAGYALNHCEKDVVIWEHDDNLSQLWKWLIGEATPQLVMDIPLNVTVGTDIRTLGLTHGQALLLKHWQRTNTTGDCWTISSWGNLPGQWTANTRSRVANEVQSIKHWRFCGPDKFVSTPATWFIDPPYQYNYRYSNRLPDFDHLSLAKFIGTIDNRSLVIACEAVGKDGEKPDYLPFVESHEAVTMRRKSDRSKELVYVRMPNS